MEIDHPKGSLQGQQTNSTHTPNNKTTNRGQVTLTWMHSPTTRDSYHPTASEEGLKRGLLPAVPCPRSRKSQTEYLVSPQVHREFNRNQNMTMISKNPRTPNLTTGKSSYIQTFKQHHNYKHNITLAWRENSKGWVLDNHIKCILPQKEISYLLLPIC